MIPVTLLSAYQYCPRKIFLQKVLKLVPEEKPALVKGKIRHKIEEEISLQTNYLISLVSRGDLDFISSLFIKHYLNITRRALLNNVRLISKVDLSIDTLTAEFTNAFKKIAVQVAENIHSLVLKHKVLGKDILKFIESEQRSEVFIESEELQLRGYVDAIEFTKNIAIPLEFKTGSMPRTGVWENHKLQLGAYILLSQEKYSDKEINFGILRYLDFEEDREVIMTPFLRDEIFEIRDKVIALLNSDKIPEKLHSEINKINNKCISCQFQKKCFELN